jgi:hypothetical protein
VTRRSKKRNAYRILVGKPEGERPLVTPTRRLEDNIEIILKGMGLEGVDWNNLAQYRDRRRAVENTAMNLRVPQSVTNLLTKKIHCSRSPLLCRITSSLINAFLHNPLCASKYNAMRHYKF